MPCMCWYNPDEESKKLFKKLCVDLVDLIKDKEKIGDPLGMTIRDVHNLLDHLYDPSLCQEKDGI